MNQIRIVNNGFLKIHNNGHAKIITAQSFAQSIQTQFSSGKINSRFQSIFTDRVEKVHYVSSNIDQNYWKLFDNFTDRIGWTSDTGVQSAYLIYDFGHTVGLSSLIIYNNNTDSFIVQISQDDNFQSYSTIITESNKLNTSNWISTVFPGTKARYVKVMIENLNIGPQDLGVGLNEIEFHGTPTIISPTNIDINANTLDGRFISASTWYLQQSSSEDDKATYAPHHVFNGFNYELTNSTYDQLYTEPRTIDYDIGNNKFWLTSNNTSFETYHIGWFIYDFGTIKTIQKINVWNFGGTISHQSLTTDKLKIEVSNNSMFSQDVTTIINDTGKYQEQFWTTFVNSPQSGRFMRVTIESNDVNVFAALSGLEVFGI